MSRRVCVNELFPRPGPCLFESELELYLFELIRFGGIDFLAKCWSSLLQELAKPCYTSGMVPQEAMREITDAASGSTIPILKHHLQALSSQSEALEALRRKLYQHMLSLRRQQRVAIARFSLSEEFMRPLFGREYGDSSVSVLPNHLWNHIMLFLSPKDVMVSLR